MYLLERENTRLFTTCTHYAPTDLYADDTQLYISFKCNTPLTSLIKLSNCISEIRVWMINNKLKINYSKTDFIVFRSPQAKPFLSGLSLIVGDIIIQQSSKVRNLGIILTSLSVLIIILVLFAGLHTFI